MGGNVVEIAPWAPIATCGKHARLKIWSWLMLDTGFSYPTTIVAQETIVQGLTSTSHFLCVFYWDNNECAHISVMRQTVGNGFFSVFPFNKNLACCEWIPWEIFQSRSIRLISDSYSFLCVTSHFGAVAHRPMFSLWLMRDLLAPFSVTATTLRRVAIVPQGPSSL